MPVPSIPTIPTVARSKGGVTAPSLQYSQAVLGTAGLVSYWRLDETTGTSAADSKGSNTGTYTGTFTLNQPPATRTGRSITVGGAGFVTATGGLLVGQTSFTIEAWVRVDTNDVDGACIVADRSTSLPFVGFRVRTSGAVNIVLFGASSGPDNFDSSGTTVTNGSFHHVAVTMSGTAIAFYVDGVAAGTAVRTVTQDGTSTTLQLGQNAVDGATSAIKGGLDEVAIYNVALSPATIAAHFAAR